MVSRMALSLNEMIKEQLKQIETGKDVLKTYEFLANHLFELEDDDLRKIVDVLDDADRSGQYLASGARYLNAIDNERFKDHIRRMTSLTIDRDREHKYIGELISALYGAEYFNRVEELSSDSNFRRMYKRLFPEGAL